MGCGKRRKASIQSPVKLQPWFLSSAELKAIPALAVKELSLGISLYDDDDDDDDDYPLPT